MGKHYQKEFLAAIDAARLAARLCRLLQPRPDLGVNVKEDQSPVTIADYGSQALVCQLLRNAFPNDAIVAEEDAAPLRAGRSDLREDVVRWVNALRSDASEANVLDWIDFGGSQPNADRFWTLDPVDGTKGFLRGRQYAVAVALLEHGQVRVAALACPRLGDGPDMTGAGSVYAAQQGVGALRLPLVANPEQQALEVSTVREAASARICQSVEAAHSAHGDAARLAGRLGVNKASVELDSQAKYAVVARGDADIYLRLPTQREYKERIWDHAAGMLILTEAGGKVTDCTGAPLDFTHGRLLKRNKGVVATNGHLHDRVIHGLRALDIGQ